MDTDTAITSCARYSRQDAFPAESRAGQAAYRHEARALYLGRPPESVPGCSAAGGLPWEAILPAAPPHNDVRAQLGAALRRDGRRTRWPVWIDPGAAILILARRSIHAVDEARAAFLRQHVRRPESDPDTRGMARGG